MINVTKERTAKKIDRLDISKYEVSSAFRELYFNKHKATKDAEIYISMVEFWKKKYADDDRNDFCEYYMNCACNADCYSSDKRKRLAVEFSQIVESLIRIIQANKLKADNDNSSDDGSSGVEFTRKTNLTKNTAVKQVKNVVAPIRQKHPEREMPNVWLLHEKEITGSKDDDDDEYSL